jgi:hypothetical protein
MLPRLLVFAAACVVLATSKLFTSESQPSTLRPPVQAIDATLRAKPGERVEGDVKRPIDWTRIAKVESSCDCIVLARRENRGGAIVTLDLTKEPKAKSFAPYIALLDASGREFDRILIDVVVESTQHDRLNAGGPP